MQNNRFDALSAALGYKSMRKFATEMSINPQAFYDFGSGKVKRLNPMIIRRVLDYHPDINPQWLTEGTGPMFLNGSTNSGIIIGDNSSASSITQDNRQYFSDSPDVLKAQIDILEERIKEKDAQIKEKDAQIKQLLDIIQGVKSNRP